MTPSHHWESPTPNATPLPRRVPVFFFTTSDDYSLDTLGQNRYSLGCSCSFLQLKCLRVVQRAPLNRTSLGTKKTMHSHRAYQRHASRSGCGVLRNEVGEFLWAAGSQREASTHGRAPKRTFCRASLSRVAHGRVDVARKVTLPHCCLWFLVDRSNVLLTVSIPLASSNDFLTV